MGLDSGHCLSKQQNKCIKSKTEFFWAVYWSLCIGGKTTLGSGLQ